MDFLFFTDLWDALLDCFPCDLTLGVSISFSVMRETSDLIENCSDGLPVSESHCGGRLCSLFVSFKIMNGDSIFCQKKWE